MVWPLIIGLALAVPIFISGAISINKLTSVASTPVLGLPGWIFAIVAIVVIIMLMRGGGGGGNDRIYIYANK